MEQPERRADTVAVPRSAIKTAAFLVAAVLVPLTGFLRGIYVEHIHLLEAIEQCRDHVKEGQHRLSALELYREEHGRAAGLLIGKWEEKHATHERRIERLSQRCDDCRSNGIKFPMQRGEISD